MKFGEQLATYAIVCLSGNQITILVTLISTENTPLPPRDKPNPMHSLHPAPSLGSLADMQSSPSYLHVVLHDFVTFPQLLPLSLFGSGTG